MQIHHRLEDEEIPEEIRQQQNDGLKGNLPKHARLVFNICPRPSPPIKANLRAHEREIGLGQTVAGQSLSGSKAGRVCTVEKE